MSALDPAGIVELAQRALVMAFYLALPLLGAAFAVGLAASIIQAATRQSDPTLNTVPKLLGVGGALLIFGAWMAGSLQGFWYDLWTHLPEMVR